MTLVNNNNTVILPISDNSYISQFRHIFHFKNPRAANVNSELENLPPYDFSKTIFLEEPFGKFYSLQNQNSISLCQGRHLVSEMQMQLIAEAHIQDRVFSTFLLKFFVL